MKKICLIHTGGTIAMQPNEQGVLEPMNKEDLLQYVPTIRNIAEIDSHFLWQLDSSDIHPNHWIQIATTINELYNQYDGFVILQGTDTMAYTATALSFMLHNLGKPVILTGAQLPITAAVSDGHNNLLNAVRFACEDIAEVAIMFGNVLLRGNRSKKLREFTLNAFDSPNFVPLSEIGIELRLHNNTIKRHTQHLKPKLQLELNIVVIKLFPGITNEHILSMIPPRTKGVVIEGYGSGNIPLGENGIQRAITMVLEQDIPVVITTQCIYGGVEYHRYAGGHFAKMKGAMSAHDMTNESALIKLMWVLGQTEHKVDIQKLYETNLRGELTPYLQTN